jgi:hypothetical protein
LHHCRDVTTSYRCGVTWLGIATLISKSEFALTLSEPDPEANGGFTHSNAQLSAT